MKNILVVDDDIHIGNMLEETLGREGYAVSRAYSGTEAAMYLSSHTPDLVLLDLMLPGLSGEDVLAHARGIPVIVVSARADVDSKVSLLYGGAVDYVTKPFEIKELLARIAVRLRGDGSFDSSRMLRCGDLTLDGDTHTVEAGGEVVRLTRTEYAILRLLMANAGQVITKQQLLDRIWGYEYVGETRTVDVHIKRLREKIKDHPQWSLTTVWGIGYKFETFASKQ